MQFEQGANPARVKALNQAAILKAIYHHGPIKRAEIAKRLGLTLPTITTNVSAMIRRGVVREAGSAQPGEGYLGRKAHPVDIVPESRRFIGVEIQGARRTLCLLDYRGRALYTRADGEDCPDYGRNMEMARDMIRDAHSRLIADSLPNSRFVELEGGHFIAAKSPDAFNRAVKEFLDDYKE